MTRSDGFIRHDLSDGGGWSPDTNKIHYTGVTDEDGVVENDVSAKTADKAGEVEIKIPAGFFHIHN